MIFVTHGRTGSVPPGRLRRAIGKRPTEARAALATTGTLIATAAASFVIA